MLLEQLHQALVDLAREHHLHDVDGLFVGDAHAVFKFALLADGFEHGVDLGTAAVHQHDVDADELHQHQIAHDSGFQIVVNHRVAAVFDDNGFARPLFDVGHCVY